MKLAPIAALALTLLTGWAAPADAASIDYTLSVPLIVVSANDPTPPDHLRGTLSYDEDAMSAIGTFSLTGAGDPISGVFSGLSLLMPVDGGATGILFNGVTDVGAQLYLNLVAEFGANATMAGTVRYCTTGCMMFDAVGATLAPADLPPVSLPGVVTAPDPVVSTVPLPPAASLFGAALASLGGLGWARRRAARPAPVV